MYAIAHVRGGGDLGAYWHVDGMLMNKRNTFTDFITCAKHLIQARALRRSLEVALPCHHASEPTLQVSSFAHSRCVTCARHWSQRRVRRG